ncbi:TIGR04197 family type VII secretion effector [Virgibacillus dakarensis]|uniref:TIGR04197 family type VII secretion effector n=1 Tax=Virgibacillus dakarensis TaxID=1917889 RepID=UPI000B44D83A|nr:TIGR04197 family type VII secretion effector [Virgibacillus dakarensis]MTW86061.1 TIGR04197 family type VII secretion effector [Virgibacillus dakarensis]
MAEVVGINIGEFQSNIEKLRSSLSGLESSIKTSRTFDKTNIAPFTDDLENTIKAVKLLEEYKTLLDTDITTLEDTGEQMRENDENLANYNNPDPESGPQPLRN